MEMQLLDFCTSTPLPIRADRWSTRHPSSHHHRHQG
jgi:hypothetical protein